MSNPRPWLSLLALRSWSSFFRLDEELPNNWLVKLTQEGAWCRQHGVYPYQVSSDCPFRATFAACCHRLGGVYVLTKWQVPVLVCLNQWHCKNGNSDRHVLKIPAQWALLWPPLGGSSKQHFLIRSRFEAFPAVCAQNVLGHLDLCPAIMADWAPDGLLAEAANCCRIFESNQISQWC